MKFLNSLVSNSRQPARRPGIADAAPQADPFNPLNPIQESQPPQPHRQPATSRRNRQQDDVPSATASSMGPRQESKSGAEISDVTPHDGQQSHRVTNLPGMAEELPGGPVTPDQPEVQPIPATRQEARKMPTEGEGGPQPEDRPTPSVSQSKRDPGTLTPHAPLAGLPDQSKPEVSQIPRRSGALEAEPAHPPVDPAALEAEAPGLLSGAAVEPVQVQEQAEQPLATNRERRQPPQGEELSHKAEPAEQREEPVKRIQASVLQEPSAPRNPLPRQPVQQTQRREIPQVRIGQINVLVEDQAPAKAKPKNGAAKPARANPFGLRGL